MNQIILKVDDFLLGGDKSKSVINNFYRFMKLIEDNNAKVSLGVVGASLHTIPKEIIDFVKERLEKSIELFNHSYGHKLNVSDAERCNAKVKEVFGVTMNTFGAQYNNITNNGYIVLNRMSEIENVYLMDYSDFYPKLKRIKNVIIISGYRELENFIPKPCSYVQWGNFKLKYKKKVDELKVYQLHPFGWNDDDFTCFEEAMNLFVKDEKQFIFPRQIIK